MTMHSSLSSGKDKKGHRSVLKRFEKLSVLMEKDKWKIGDSVFGLPKVKTLKVKIKKEKAVEAAAEGAEQAQATAAPAAGVKPQAGAAGAAAGAAKPQAKKEEKKK